MSARTLITGVTGYVGARVASKVLNESDAPVVLWTQASSADEAAARTKVLEQKFGAASLRIQYRFGRLEDAEPFASVDASEIGTIVHSAAVTRFNVDQETARRVNTEGSEKVFKFAQSCPKLERLAHVSTLYTSGLTEGPIEEEAFDSVAGFANHYERSKYAVEQLLMREYSSLPWQAFRVATIVADDDDGVVTQYNAVHNTLKLVYYGLISTVPGDVATPLYFVTGKFVTDAIVQVLKKPLNHSFFNVAHTEAESLRLGELIDIAFAEFETEAGFKSRRVLKPLFVDYESFDMLVRGTEGFSGGVLRQAIDSISPFARQLFVSKHVNNDKLASTIDDYRAVDVAPLVKGVCSHLMRTRWGRLS